jgi:2-succinyl-6-hydroxy-2,4-cyclohexadiene-1-carboxylate synthase
MSSRPLVCLHGFLGAPSTWDSVEKLIDMSPIANRLILPGHGRDPWFPFGAADFDASVDALAAKILERDPVVLLGYSMGARIALALALRHPKKIASAILIGVDAGIEDEAMRAERIAWEDAWAERAANEGIEAFASAWENLPIFDSQKNLSASVRAQLRAQRTSHTSLGISWAMRALGLGRMPSLGRLLEQTDVPLTLMTGALDAKFTAKSRAIALRAKNANAVIVENVGHNVALEAPHAVAKEVERKLRA